MDKFDKVIGFIVLSLVVIVIVQAVGQKLVVSGECYQELAQKVCDDFNNTYKAYYSAYVYCLDENRQERKYYFSDEEISLCSS